MPEGPAHFFLNDLIALTLYDGQSKLGSTSLSTVELGYNVMKGTEYTVSLKTNVVISEKNNSMVNSEELIGNTDYLTL
jgi:hypothetical protein